MMFCLKGAPGVPTALQAVATPDTRNGGSINHGRLFRPSGPHHPLNETKMHSNIAVLARFSPFSPLMLLFFAGCLGIFAPAGAQNRYLAARTEVNDGPKMPNLQYLTEKLWEADDYCFENGLNTEVGIFIDLGMNSGYYRCWVIGFGDGVIRHEGLVAHGSGKNDWLPTGTRKYSNEKGSLLSSLGKYKTGTSFMGQYGLSYRLHGLEASNSNAFSRAIVLHAHRDIPDFQSSRALFQSWGCPSVSPNFLKKLCAIIDKSEKPLLIWIFDSTR